MSTKILKMRSGEEIIASVEITFNSGGSLISAYILKDPCLLVPVPSKDGQYRGNMAIVPWMATVKQANGITVPADAVLFSADPITELLNEYSQAFGSGLVVPSDAVTRPALKLV